MFDSLEKHYLRKLLGKIKYSELDPYEMSEFAFSPIGNTIIEKLKDEKLEEHSEKLFKQNPNRKRPCFEFENHIGIAIREKLNYQSDSSFDVISKWNKEETEKYLQDVIGSISCEKVEFDKLVTFLTDLAKSKTCR